MCERVRGCVFCARGSCCQQRWGDGWLTVVAVEGDVCSCLGGGGAGGTLTPTPSLTAAGAGMCVSASPQTHAHITFNGCQQLRGGWVLPDFDWVVGQWRVLTHCASNAG